jgi:hypothetical protein
VWLGLEIIGSCLRDTNAVDSARPTPKRHLSPLAIGGAVRARILFGWIIGTGSKAALLIGYLVGAALMILGAIVEAFIGVDAERGSLEHVATPLILQALAAIANRDRAVATALCRRPKPRKRLDVTAPIRLRNSTA